MAMIYEYGQMVGYPIRMVTMFGAHPHCYLLNSNGTVSSSTKLYSSTWYSELIQQIFHMYHLKQTKYFKFHCRTVKFQTYFAGMV